MSASWILWFDELGLDDVPRVGGKNASLGELRRALAPRGVRIPDGFATTADAYRAFLHESGLEAVLDRAFEGLDVRDLDRLQQAGRTAREALLGAALPAPLAEGVRTAYRRLEAEHGAGCDVAVRSSATAEDLPEASFAGQQETFLNVRGEAALLEAVRRCFASLFTDRAIVYRAERGYRHRDVALSVGVQKMVRSDLGGAGVMFSLDPESGFRDVVVINAAWGLGESVVQGTVNPDEYVVFKPTLRQGFRPLLQRRLGSKELKLVYDEGGTRPVKSVPVPPEDRARFVLSEDEILTLSRWACLVEDHYSARHDSATPMDMEWARDGRSGELFLLQARPETVHARESGLVLERHVLDEAGQVLAAGRSVGEKIGAGRARVIRSAAGLGQLGQGEVLVTEMTDPDWEPVLRRAAAIVTDRGGRTCHAAIVSRELGIPAVVGTERGTSQVPDGAEVTVSCAEGADGRVYRGRLASHVERTDLAALERPRTKIMLNVGDPAQALRLSLLPSDGVGLARLEFIISSHIRAHPMALLHPERIADRAERAEVER
ncbi:MAG TPA: phosphoenolpyruvate synthase, partial [Longimicrobium sp.]|nr:phosphoenolpyruvate synthase [Longimicrobium sp.]